jgi:hypothetical protein
MANELGITVSEDTGLLWKVVKFIAFGILLNALIELCPIDLAVMAQIILVFTLPIVIVAVMLGLAGTELLQEAWGMIADSDRVREKLDELRNAATATA